jgi:adenylosuccinate lyase
MRATGCDPGVLQRLAEDPRLPLDADELAALMSDPLQFTGAAASQVREVGRRVGELVGEYPQAAAYVPGAIL